MYVKLECSGYFFCDSGVSGNSFYLMVVDCSGDGNGVIYIIGGWVVGCIGFGRICVERW